MSSLLILPVDIHRHVLKYIYNDVMKQLKISHRNRERKRDLVGNLNKILQNGTYRKEENEDARIRFFICNPTVSTALLRSL